KGDLKFLGDKERGFDLCVLSKEAQRLHDITQQLQQWIAGTESISERANWFTTAIEMVDQGQCPADLRAFVADLVAFASTSSVPRAARRGNRA
ncbi:MAG: hypothetical protein QGF59_25785, partial [Pirellulaceae bacterium]|nr:hypothetical protein [Pirellulaceae bacterium]